MLDLFMKSTSDLLDKVTVEFIK